MSDRLCDAKASLDRNILKTIRIIDHTFYTQKADLAVFRVRDLPFGFYVYNVFMKQPPAGMSAFPFFLENRKADQDKKMH